MKIFCDTHVHCYQFEQLTDLLDHAVVNFAKQGKADACVLFFTDGQADPTWATLLPLVEKGGEHGVERHGWVFHYNDRSGFILAEKGSNTLWLAPAKQVNSARRLEYLLLGCEQRVADGLPDEQVLSEYGSRYAVICPWGVGKWLGARAKLLSELIQRHGESFLLGDNGGRPKVWFRVPPFRQITRRVVNGTDPLPINGELSRVAAFGICLEVPTNDLTVADLISAIKLSNHQNYGKNLGLVRFFVAQIKMLLR